MTRKTPVYKASPWPARDAELTELWAQGHTTAIIAARMGIRKNAVIGRAHRLKLPPRPSPIRPRMTPEQLAAASVKARNRALVFAKRAEQRARAKMPIAAQLSPHQCRYILGEREDFGGRWSDVPVCQERALVGKPYCATHMALCYHERTSPNYRHEYNKIMATGDTIRTPGAAHYVETT